MQLSRLDITQHPPKRPPTVSVPPVEDTVTEQGAAEAPACDAELVEAEEVPALLFDAVAAPVAIPAEEIVDVGTLNGSEPQSGAPKMKINALDVEQNLTPPRLVALELDEVAGGAVTAVPGPGLTCGGLT